ncbi:MAG: FAD-dependent monooxygenase [Bacteroidales bacterium]
MSQLLTKNTEVLIIGAGPTGLMMACQLAIHGVAFRIVDKNESSSKASGALIVQARTLEIFAQMGISAEAVKEGIIADNLNIRFNGKKVAGVSLKNIGADLSPFPFLLMLEQSKTEKLLLKFIGERGHTVERATQFKSFTQDNEGVTSVIILPDKSEQTVCSKYIIAADGAKSSIRQSLNIPFNGKLYPKPIFIVDCKATTDFAPDEINFLFTQSYVAGFFPLKNFRWRIDSNLPKALEKMDFISFDDVAKDFSTWNKAKITFQNLEWFSVTHSQQKYASVVRVHNCFLAGDAAHVNTPVGSQGMNTGLQDAYNLAWKLSFVIKNKAKPDILDTYSSERLAISKGFGRYADSVFKILTSRNMLVKIFRFFVLRVLLRLVFPVVESKIVFRLMFFKAISQIGIHYRKSILSYRETEDVFSPKAPKPGDRLLYAGFLSDGRITNSYEIMDGSCFNLFVFADAMPFEMKSLAEKYNLHVLLIKKLRKTNSIYEKLYIKESGYYLVRPDMHIALRSATLDTAHLINYLQQHLI